MTRILHPSFAALAITVVASLVGCRRAEQIQSYTIPKETKPAPTASQNLAAPTDRMLAAILPASDRAWFFKVVGPAAAVDKHAAAINDFYGKLTIADDGRAKWTLPDGWQEKPGNEMRLATLVIPTEATPLEMTVNALPWRGTEDDVVSNVNRWRGQLNLSPVDVKALPEFTREVKVGDRTMTLVDLRGHFQGAGMMAPFAGRGPMSGPAMTGAPGKEGARLDLPPGHPQIDAASSPPSAAPSAVGTADATPNFDTPSSWTQIPVPPGGMRKAAFSIADGDRQAQVTVIDFSADAGPSIGGPLVNVNRWRGEVSLSPIQQDGLSEVTESIEIDGKPATFVTAIPDISQPDQSKADKATLAAMVNTGDRIWFLKMTGSRELVAAQQAEFKKFLQSVKFPANK